jgi:pimeloyl-ACP methyl ester carboxylesterase
MRPGAGHGYLRGDDVVRGADRGSRWLLIGLLLAVVFAACSRDTAPVEEAAPPAPSAEPAAAAPATATAAPTPAAARRAPRLEPEACATFKVDDTRPDRPVRCAYLPVPEDRGDPNGRSIRLAVAIFEAAGADADEAPLVWLDGGPGGASVEQIASLITGATGRLILPGGRSLTADRDLVLIDQRGTGHSQPSLRCPELEPFDRPGTDPAVGRAEADRAVVSAALACRDRLTAERVNLAAYTSAESAADINDLRLALGREQVNLYGVSYGTRLALTVMRDFPTAVRSAVLDSPVPLQVDLYTGAFSGAQRALDLVFEGCAADRACRAAYPDLRQTFYDLVARLNADPLPFTSQNAATGRSEPAVLTGDDLVGALFDILYVTPAVPLVPAIIANVRDGRLDSFLLLLRQIAESGSISQAMYYSVQCGEEAPFGSASDRVAAERTVRPELAQALRPVFGGRMQSICAAWPARRAAPVENEPVRSSIPTLILAGQHDPITPPAFAEVAATTLPNSTVVVFPGVAHGALLSTRTCPYDIMRAFLRNPTTRPNVECVAEMKPPAWLVRR